MRNGDSNKIKIETLGITLNILNIYVWNVIDKFQARSRTHAVIIAAQAAIVGNSIAHILQLKAET